MKYKKNKIKPPKVKVYYKKKYLGKFNEYEFNDLLIQVKQSKYKPNSLQVHTNNKVYKIQSYKGVIIQNDFCFNLLDKQMKQLMGY